MQFIHVTHHAPPAGRNLKLADTMKDKTMTKISTLVSAVLIVSATSFNVAAAEGEYYDGASKQAAHSVDATVTGSIAADAERALPKGEADAAINSGDYYTGAQRPI